MNFTNYRSKSFFYKLFTGQYSLDVVLAVVVLFLCIIVIFLSFLLDYFRGIPLTAAIIVGALAYLAFRNKLKSSIILPSFRSRNIIRLLCHIVFVVSSSAMVYIMWSNLYDRPPVFFYLLILALFSIVINILALNETNKLQIAVVLVKIFVLSIILFLSIYHEFPGIFGNDPWLHNEWIQETIDTGHITPGLYASNDYYLFPFFHIWSAMTQIVTQVSTYNAIFISTGTLIVFSGLFIFLIGARLVNVKAGLLATLLVLFSDQTISRSTGIIAMSLAFCFFPAILYLVFCRDKKSASDTSLAVLLTVGVILTHTIAALATLLTLIVIYIVTKIFKKSDKSTFSFEPVTIALITFFALFMLFRWMQPTPGQSPFLDMNVRNLASTLQSQAQFVMLGTGPIKAVAPAVTVIDEGGYILLLAFGVFGALACFNPRHRSGVMIVIASLAAFFVVVPNVFEVFGVTVLLPDRWQIFTYVILSIVAVFGLFHLASIIPGNIIKTGAISLMVLAALFFMTTNKYANTDSPMVFNGADRLGFTEAEFDTITTLSGIEAGRPMTDFYYGSTFPYIIGLDQYNDMLQENSRVFVQRSYYLEHPEWDRYYVGSIINSLPEEKRTERVMISDYIHVWGIDNWPIIYRNNSVTVYSDAPLITQN